MYIKMPPCEGGTFVKPIFWLPALCDLRNLTYSQLFDNYFLSMYGILFNYLQ
jgi:hypothetical protein